MSDAAELGPVPPRPEPRIVTVGISEGRFTGWRARVRVDFPASLIREFESGNPDRMLAAAGELILEWNFPDRDGRLAATLEDADPFAGVAEIIRTAMKAVSSLPPA